MTIEEVIKQLDNLKRYCQYEIGKGDEITRKDVQALNKAIEVMEKEMPIKPQKILRAFEYRFGDCPNCNKISDINYRHCKYCGQKLDWEV